MTEKISAEVILDPELASQDLVLFAQATPLILTLSRVNNEGLNKAVQIISQLDSQTEILMSPYQFIGLGVVFGAIAGTGYGVYKTIADQETNKAKIIENILGNAFTFGLSTGVFCFTLISTQSGGLE